MDTGDVILAATEWIFHLSYDWLVLACLASKQVKIALPATNRPAQCNFFSLIRKTETEKVEGRSQLLTGRCFSLFVSRDDFHFKTETRGIMCVPVNISGPIFGDNDIPVPSVTLGQDSHRLNINTKQTGFRGLVWK